MRWMLMVTAVLAAGYSGFWFMGRADRTEAVEVFSERLANGGVSTSHSDLAVRGFPSRHDVSVRDLAFAGRAWRWDLPFLEAASLSYRPGEVIVTFPPEQRLTIGPVVLRLQAETLRARLSLTSQGELLALTLEGTGLAGDLLRTERMLLAMRKIEGTRYEVYLDMIDAGVVVSEVGRVQAQGEVSFAGPLDQMALEDFPDVTGFTLTGPGAEAVRAMLPAGLR